MTTILLFLLILAILVLAHEWGHFFTARFFGMKVHEFGIGFPPRLCGFYHDPKTGKKVFVWGKGKSSLKNTVSGQDKNDLIEKNEFPATLYSLNLLPLGGFCQIKGENGDESTQDGSDSIENCVQDSFSAKKSWQKIVVLSAGVFMNFILASLVLGFGLMVGLPADFSGGVDEKAIVIEEPSVIIEQIVKNSPAEKVGLSYGDKILFLNETAIKNTLELNAFITANQDKEMEMIVLRNNEKINFKIIPEKNENRYLIGVMIADAGIVRYPWYIAFYKGFLAAIIGFVNIFISFYLLLKNLILGQGLIFDVSGPVGIVNLVGESAKLGFNYILNLIAMLSLSLAAINILPIPALDGGRILFILIGKIKGSPVKQKYENFAHTIGFILLMALIVLVTWRDILNLIR
ncbi:MAG: RIP metalloprotease RseP [Patescibacteria group bacterium]